MFIRFCNWVFDNKDFLLALIALILTVIQFVISCVNNKEKYKVLVDNTDLSTVGNKNVLLVRMTIINSSSSTLNITKIFFLNKKDIILCKLNKTWSGERYYPKFPETDIPRTERIFSAQFPISIQPNGAVNELIRFESDKDFDIMNDYLVFKISTNKKTRKIRVKDRVR